MAQGVMPTPGSPQAQGPWVYMVGRRGWRGSGDIFGCVCARNEAAHSPGIKTLRQWKPGLPGLSPAAK